MLVDCCQNPGCKEASISRTVAEEMIKQCASEDVSLFGELDSLVRDLPKDQWPQEHEVVSNLLSGFPEASRTLGLSTKIVASCQPLPGHSLTEPSTITETDSIIDQGLMGFERSSAVQHNLKESSHVTDIIDPWIKEYEQPGPAGLEKS